MSGSKSRKGSGASSSSKQPRDVVYFTDRCLGLHLVPNALRAAGVRVEVQADHFAEDTPDSVWIEEVGHRGWIILSKDKHLRHNQIELVALLQSKTHSFLLTSGNLTGALMAQALVAALPTIQSIVNKFSPPFVGTVSAAGRVAVYLTSSDLIARVAAAPRKHPHE